jgi:3-hydroxyisobutyrate dehydrogenase-like beta-hydroxyacid dehydrogenase
MQASMGRAPVLDVKAPVILRRDFAPSFPLRLMHKDLTLALELAKQLNVSLPVGTAARAAYDDVLRAAREDVDYAAVARYYEKT